MIQHDVTSPRPYSRIHLVSGTRGSAKKWPSPAKIAVGHNWTDPTQMSILEDMFTPGIVKKVGEMTKELVVLEAWILLWIGAQLIV